MCRNGSTCIPLEKGYTAPTNKNKGGIRFYRCDCTKIESTSRFYAGYECEYVSTDICLLGPLAGTGTSFCTNDGECKHKYLPDDDDFVKDPAVWVVAFFFACLIVSLLKL